MILAGRRNSGCDMTDEVRDREESGNGSLLDGEGGRQSELMGHIVR